MRISRTTRSCTLHIPIYVTPIGAFLGTHSRCFRSCRLMGAFISSPLPPVLLRHDVQQGPFALRTLLRFNASTSLAATVSPSVDFPVDAGYTTALASADFSVGTRTVSPVARLVLVIV